MTKLRRETRTEKKDSINKNIVSEVKNKRNEMNSTLDTREKNTVTLKINPSKFSKTK